MTKHSQVCPYCEHVIGDMAWRKQKIIYIIKQLPVPCTLEQIYKFRNKTGGIMWKEVFMELINQLEDEGKITFDVKPKFHGSKVDIIYVMLKEVQTNGEQTRSETQRVCNP